MSSVGPVNSSPTIDPDATDAPAAAPSSPAPTVPLTVGPNRPSAIKLIAIVALIVALDILIFFGIGYLLGTLIL